MDQERLRQRLDEMTSEQLDELIDDMQIYTTEDLDDESREDKIMMITAHSLQYSEDELNEMLFGKEEF